MFEIVLSCDALDRHEPLARTSERLSARMGMWVQMHRIMKRFGDDLDMAENIWIDADGALCEGVEWSQPQPGGGRSQFRLYVREQTGRTDGVESIDESEVGE